MWELRKFIIWQNTLIVCRILMKSKKIQDISSNKYWNEWKLEIVEIQHIRIYVIHIDISSCLYIVQGGLGDQFIFCWKWFTMAYFWIRFLKICSLFLMFKNWTENFNRWNVKYLQKKYDINMIGNKIFTVFSFWALRIVEGNNISGPFLSVYFSH